jgi:hypothetical protein
MSSEAGTLEDVELSLSFALVKCSCGNERQAGQLCKVCGCQGTEFDEYLERRREIVAALDLQVVAPHEPAPASLESLWVTLRGWLDDFTTAIEQTNQGSPHEASGRLQRAVDNLSVLSTHVIAAPKLRPRLAEWRAVDRVLQMNARLIDHWTRALVAPTPAAVNDEAESGQAALDQAAAIIARFNAVSDERAALDELELTDEYGDVVAGAAGAFTLAGARNLIEFEQSGAALFERMTGTRACPVGFGIRLQMLNLIVESSFDEDRFWESTRAAYRAMIDSSEAFARLARDERWRRDFVLISREARDAGPEAAAITAAGANRRRELRSGIRLGATITERLAPGLVATLLSIKRRNAYTRERAKEIRTLLNEGNAAGYGSLLQGIDLAFRDADAHGEFEISDDGVRFTGTRREYDFLSDEELLDRVFMGFESVSALHVGIAAALPAVGVEHEELEEILVDQPEPSEMARILMAMNGWEDIQVQRDGKTLRIRGTRKVETPTTVAATLLPAIDEDVEELILEGEGIGRLCVARGPVAPFRRAAATSDPAEKHAASLEALATWTIDGKCPIAGSSLRKVVALTALEVLSPATQQEDALATLRALAGLTNRLAANGLLASRRDRRLVEAVSAALELREQAVTGHLSPERVPQVVTALAGLAPERVPDLRATW